VNRRERFLETMAFGSPDRPASGDYFYYEATRNRWEREGLPVGVDLTDYFGMDFDPFKWQVPVNGVCLLPDFGIKVLQEDEHFKTIQNPDGGIVKILKNEPPPAMPQWVRYPLACRADWKDYQRRLDPNTPERLPAEFPQLVESYRERDYPLGMWVGGTYGYLRNWWGVEELSVLFYDDPILIEEMLEHLTYLSLGVFDRVISTGVRLDWVMFWEDMAYKTGPLISPEMFKRYCLPYYKTIMEKIRSAGIPVVMVDSDGNIEELIPLWLDVGVSIMHPMEVAAGMDVVKIRRQYKKKVGFFGGIDKRILAGTREKMAAVIPPILESCFAEGGFIPACDHAIPPDVSLDNYRFYRELVRTAAKKMGYRE
jgi:hypothetical protein